VSGVRGEGRQNFVFVDNGEVFFFDNSSTNVIALGGSEFTMHYAIGWRERERELEVL
jgi:hypothetical protein